MSIPIKHRRNPKLEIGDRVRVLGELGVVSGFIPNKLKSVHVLFRPGFGGVYFPFECEKTNGCHEAIRAALNTSEARGQ